jgi:antitoxin component YwqK of YwqJK toxin-antitoxin module
MKNLLVIISILLFTQGYSQSDTIEFKSAFGDSGFFCEMANGIEDGWLISYYNNTEIKYTEGKWKNNNMTGVWIYYDKKGAIDVIGEYIQGDSIQKDTILCENLDNGLLIDIPINRIRSYRNGNWKYYDNDGTLRKERYYKEGELIETKEY